MFDYRIELLIVLAVERPCLFKKRLSTFKLKLFRHSENMPLLVKCMEVIVGCSINFSPLVCKLISGVMPFCEGLISRPSEQSRMRCLNKRGRESWDRAEQKSLYKKYSPHELGEQTFVRMGAQRRKESAASPP